MSTDTQARAEVPARPARSRGYRFSVVGIVGELMMFAGILLALFVAWQLFYTDVQGERVQREEVEQTEWLAPEVAEITSDEPADDAMQTISDELKMRGVDPPAMEYPDFLDKVASMMVPRWGEDYVKMVYEGITRKDVLDPLGIGHYPEADFDSALPGEIGNFSLSAHRTTYGKPFADVSELEEGDSLIFQTKDAWFVYKVESWQIVLPQDVQVIAPKPNEPGVEPDDRYITLTTCHPKFSAAERWVVHGRLDYWAPVGHGVPEELLEIPA